jgi:hypothetical protein
MTDVKENEQNWIDALISENAADIPGACPTCRGREYIKEANGVRKCECVAPAMYAGFYANAGIPPLYYGMTINRNWNVRQDVSGQTLTPLNMTAKERIGQFITKYERALPAIVAGLPFVLVQSHARTKIRSLRLTGATNSGKSMVASILAMACVRMGLTVRYFDFADLRHRLGDFNNRDDQDTIVEDFRTRDYIVIDNVFDLNAGEYVTGEFERIARLRAGTGKPTIITNDHRFENKSLGSGWQSLINNCYEIRLP